MRRENDTWYFYNIESIKNNNKPSNKPINLLRQPILGLFWTHLLAMSQKLQHWTSAKMPIFWTHPSICWRNIWMAPYWWWIGCKLCQIQHSNTWEIWSTLCPSFVTRYDGKKVNVLDRDYLGLKYFPNQLCNEYVLSQK